MPVKWTWTAWSSTLPLPWAGIWLFRVTVPPVNEKDWSTVGWLGRLMAVPFTVSTPSIRLALAAPVSLRQVEETCLATRLTV